MRVVFLLGFVAVIFTSCICAADDSNKRKYTGGDEGYTRQVDRLEEILSLGVFTTRHLIPPEDILSLIELIIEILDALEPLIPIDPSAPTNAPTTPLCKK